MSDRESDPEVYVSSVAPGAETSNSQPASLPALTLAERLNIPNTTFRRYAKKISETEFTPWTRSKDPDGVSWEYRQETKKYYPAN